MPAGIYNIVIEQGADFDRELTWRDATGALVDVSGYTAQAMGRDNQESATAIFDLSVGSGITLGGAAGTIALFIAGATTAAYSALTGVWDLFLTDTAGTGKVTKLLRGVMIIERGVTR